MFAVKQTLMPQYLWAHVVVTEEIETSMSQYDLSCVLCALSSLGCYCHTVYVHVLGALHQIVVHSTSFVMYCLSSNIVCGFMCMCVYVCVCMCVCVYVCGGGGVCVCVVVVCVCVCCVCVCLFLVLSSHVSGHAFAHQDAKMVCDRLQEGENSKTKLTWGCSFLPCILHNTCTIHSHLSTSFQCFYISSRALRIGWSISLP